MSGIVCIINLDGTPVDRSLLERMTCFMTYRGPDAQEVWCEGHVGFGHTMLRTTFEAETERQPLSRDGKVWLTSDVRIDGRVELIDKLKIKGSEAANANDAELILHAYEVWGETCLDHLLGDFAFAIWDGPRRKLFCARDRFGIKPFYYAKVGNTLIVSNTLNCIREHPTVSDSLNEQAIGDFLLGGVNLEPTTTTFSDIKRLPPAHVLACSDDQLRTSRYWQLTVDQEIKYKHASEYVERFKELLNRAVYDRLRTRQAGIFMSGGLDSSTIAAAVCELASNGAGPIDLRAYTIAFDSLIPDRERYYSQLVAQALGLPISYLVADDYRLFQDWEKSKLRRPEPSSRPLLAINVAHFEQAAKDNRVALTGWDGDGVLREVPRYYFGALRKHRRLGRFGLDAWRYLRAQRELPQIGFRTAIKRFFGNSVSEESGKLPVWLNEAFVARANLRERWEQIKEWPPPTHPRRPTAFLVYSFRGWSGLFESYDPGVTGLTLEARHPLFDLRLMNYLLALPPVPWCIKKELLRLATREVLPEEIRLRPKTTLAGNTEFEQLQRPESKWVDRFQPTPRLSEYVDRQRIPRLFRESDPNEVTTNIRPLCLNYWLEGFN
jgi:asparagine synthase (glutamine-hydrolysing)